MWKTLKTCDCSIQCKGPVLHVHLVEEIELNSFVVVKCSKQTESSKLLGKLVRASKPTYSCGENTVTFYWCTHGGGVRCVCFALST